MKTILLPLLALLPFFGLSQDFKFEVKDAYESPTLLEDNFNYHYHRTHHPKEGFKYVAVVGTIISATEERGEVEHEKISLTKGEETYLLSGEIDLDWMLFDDGASDMRFNKKLNWVSVVFEVPMDLNAATLNLDTKSFEIKFNKEAKYKAPEFSCTVLKTELTSSVTEKNYYNRKDKVNTSYTTEKKSLQGNLLKVMIEMHVSKTEEFHNIINFTNHEIVMVMPNNIVIVAAGGSGSGNSLSENFNLNVREGNSNTMILFFHAGDESTDYFKGASLYFKGHKIATL